ncbi:MAG TPA: hypothetical protein VHX65_18685 [Pirellulales bacterium]|nr:hypothetical protein [Pirellulales bacterium]
MKSDGKAAKLQKVLIIQAEIGPDSKTVYGIVGCHFMRAANADELTDIRPIEAARH